MNFRSLRERAGLSQAQLAKRSGVEQTTISQLELGKVRDPRWSTLKALAQVLGTRPERIATALEQTARKRIA